MEPVAGPHIIAAAAHDEWPTGQRHADAVIDAKEILDHLAQAVIVTDWRSIPLLTNRTAGEILAEADGLRVDANGLSAAHAQECATLRWTIAAVCRAPRQDNAPRFVVVSRPSLRRPLTLLIAPQCAGLDRSPARAIVFISDPERCATVPSSLLQRAYGLTPMEAIVAIEIARGDGLQSVATKLGVSVSTARTHLQHVFEKMGARRQAQLSWLIMGSCVGLRLSGGDHDTRRSRSTQPHPFE
jgi:DNA-binding CsgD family transcriptional regulator